MKRSEFIQKASIEFQERSNAQQYSGYSYDGLTEEFLSIFEDFGMRPPVEGSLKSQMAAVHNQWEEEDETK